MAYRKSHVSFDDGPLGERGLDGWSDENQVGRRHASSRSIIYNSTDLELQRVEEIFGNDKDLLGLCRLASRLHYELIFFPVGVVVRRLRCKIFKDFLAKRHSGCWQKASRRIFFWLWSFVVAVFPLVALVNVYGHDNIAKCHPMPEDQDLKAFGALLGWELGFLPAASVGVGTDRSSETSGPHVLARGRCLMFHFLSAHSAAVVFVSLATPIALTILWGMIAKSCIELHNRVSDADSLEDSCFLRVKRAAFFPLLYFWYKHMDQQVPRVKYANDPVEDDLVVCSNSPPSLYISFAYLTFWAEMLFLGYLSGRFLPLLVAAWSSSKVLCWITDRALGGDAATMLEVESQLRSWTPMDVSGNFVRTGRDSVIDKIMFAIKKGCKHLNLTDYSSWTSSRSAQTRTLDFSHWSQQRAAHASLVWMLFSRNTGTSYFLVLGSLFRKAIQLA